MKEHPQFDEDFDLYVLGTLDLEERDAIELHLTHCAECASRLEEARARMATLALAAPLETPPAVVRDRLMQRLHAERQKLRRGSPDAASPFWRWVMPFGQWAVMAPALFSIILLVAAGWMAAENRRMSAEVSQLEKTQEDLEAARNEQTAEVARARSVLEVLTAADTLKITLVAGAAPPAPQGKAFYNPSKGLVFYAANLPSLPANKAYELWLVPASGNPIGAGVFSTDAHGNGEVILPTLPAGVTAKAFAVTLEPAGGSPTPTGAKVLVGVVS